jgi:hypothetical protein
MVLGSMYGTRGRAEEYCWISFATIALLREVAEERV